MATKDPLLWSDTNMAHSFMLHLETLGVTTAIILAAKHLTVDGRTASDLPAGTGVLGRHFSVSDTGGLVCFSAP